jgi:hypothetical protein
MRRLVELVFLAIDAKRLEWAVEVIAAEQRVLPMLLSHGRLANVESRPHLVQSAAGTPTWLSLCQEEDAMRGSLTLLHPLQLTGILLRRFTVLAF